MSEQTGTSGTSGTSIKRAGGYLVRVGWKAEGYSVDTKTEGRYRLVKFLLAALAVAVGIAVALFGEWLLFDVVGPLVRSRTTLIAFYPMLWQLLIYGLTFICGWYIYRSILARMGNKMVHGFERRDEGFSVLEQRRRAAFSRKRDYLAGVIGLGLLLSPAIWPEDYGSLRLFVGLLILSRIVEGLLFKFWLTKAE
jgi:hypothetical protein